VSEIIEIRSYRLKAGTEDRFSQIMREQSLPMLRLAGMQVILARASLHAADCYVLVRGYRDLEHRTESQQAFYGSPAWMQGPRDAIMECIETYTTVVVEAGLLSAFGEKGVRDETQ
jgi:hypothetical protein